MAIPKILKSSDTYSPITHITSFDDLKVILKAILVDGIDEIGGSCGWTEMFDDANGWVVRDANTGNTRDWMFQPFTYAGNKLVDVRGCDTASSTTNGVNVFPSFATRPFDATGDLSAYRNINPSWQLFNGSESTKITNWTVVATQSVCYVFYGYPNRDIVLDDTYGVAQFAFGHFTAHGANVETAFVTGCGYSSETNVVRNSILTGAAYATSGNRFIQRTPDSDPGNGLLWFDVDADKIAIRKAGESSVSIALGIESRTGMPHLTSMDDPLITSNPWLFFGDVVIGGLPGMSHVSAYNLPRVSNMLQTTLSDGKEYLVVRVGGSSASQGPLMLVNLTDDWDA